MRSGLTEQGIIPFLKGGGVIIIEVIIPPLFKRGWSNHYRSDHTPPL